MIERRRTKSKRNHSNQRARTVQVRQNSKKLCLRGPIERRVTNIKWKLLQEENEAYVYVGQCRAILNEAECDESVSEWMKESEVMLRAAVEL